MRLIRAAGCLAVSGAVVFAASLPRSHEQVPQGQRSACRRLRRRQLVTWLAGAPSVCLNSRPDRAGAAAPVCHHSCHRAEVAGWCADAGGSSAAALTHTAMTHLCRRGMGTLCGCRAGRPAGQSTPAPAAAPPWRDWPRDVAPGDCEGCHRCGVERAAAHCRGSAPGAPWRWCALPTYSGPACAAPAARPAKQPGKHPSSF